RRMPGTKGENGGGSHRYPGSRNVIVPLYDRLKINGTHDPNDGMFLFLVLIDIVSDVIEHSFCFRERFVACFMNDSYNTKKNGLIVRDVRIDFLFPGAVKRLICRACKSLGVGIRRAPVVLIAIPVQRNQDEKWLRPNSARNAARTPISLDNSL